MNHTSPFRQAGRPHLLMSLLLLTACGKETSTTASTQEAKTDVVKTDVVKTKEVANKATEAEKLQEVANKATDAEKPRASAPIDLKSLKLSSVPPSNEVLEALHKDTVLAFGATYPADVYCNIDTMGNPEDVEVFQIPSHDDIFIYLCAGSLDGQENTVSVFQKDKNPKTKKQSPEASTYRISDKVLLATVKQLLASQ